MLHNVYTSESSRCFQFMAERQIKYTTKWPTSKRADLRGRITQYLIVEKLMDNMIRVKTLIAKQFSKCLNDMTRSNAIDY